MLPCPERERRSLSFVIPLSRNNGCEVETCPSDGVRQRPHLEGRRSVAAQTRDGL